MINNDIVPGFDDENDEVLRMQLETVDNVAGGLIVHLDGSITTDNADCTRRRLKKAIEAGYLRFVISLRAFNFVSELTLGCLTDCFKTVRLKGGDVVLVDLPPSMFEVFQLLGFTGYFNLRKNVPHGVAFFTQKGPFPIVFRCSRCAEWIEARQAGMISCVKCEAGFSISAVGNVSQNRVEESHTQEKTSRAEAPTRHVTVILVNMIDYVSLCERTLDMMTLLNQHYFNFVHEAIVESGGFLREIIGDRQFAYWTGNNSEENALCACTAAINTANRIAADNMDLPTELRFKVNIGIATGDTLFIVDDRYQIGAGPLGGKAALLVGFGKRLSKRILLDYETYRQIAKRLKVQRIEAETPTGAPVYALYGVHSDRTPETRRRT